MSDKKFWSDNSITIEDLQKVNSSLFQQYPTNVPCSDKALDESMKEAVSLFSQSKPIRSIIVHPDRLHIAYSITHTPQQILDKAKGGDWGAQKAILQVFDDLSDKNALIVKLQGKIAKLKKRRKRK